MNHINRRNFLTAVAGTASFLSAYRSGVYGAETIAPPPQVPLGKTGLTVSRVAQGTGMRGYNRQSNHTRMGFEKLVGLLRHDYDRGVTFFDMADLYGTHVYCREALRFIPREKVTLLTKLWWRYDRNMSPEFQRKSAQMALQRFQHEIATDYLDIVFLHCLSDPQWDTKLRPYMDVLSEAKQRKKVRAVGVSCHSLRALDTAADSPWVDAVFARINFKGAKMGGTPAEAIAVLKKLKKNGKAVIGMKIYGEGTLAGSKDKCMEFAQNLGLLDAMTIGAESTEQMDETLKLLAKYPAKAVKTG